VCIGKAAPWTEVPHNFATGSVDVLGQLTLRCQVLNGPGSVTVLQATTIEVGAQE
jgi:hypothetical protein